VGVRGRVQITSPIESTVLHFNHSYDRRPPLCDRQGFRHIDQNSHTARMIPGDSEDCGRLPTPRPAPRRREEGFRVRKIPVVHVADRGRSVRSGTDSQDSTAPLFGLIFTRQAIVPAGKGPKNDGDRRNLCATVTAQFDFCRRGTRVHFERGEVRNSATVPLRQK
jgi:hypothetical protein